jgi:hypothetical protein
LKSTCDTAGGGNLILGWHMRGNVRLDKGGWGWVKQRSRIPSIWSDSLLVARSGGRSTSAVAVVSPPAPVVCTVPWILSIWSTLEQPSQSSVHFDRL